MCMIYVWGNVLRCQPVKGEDNSNLSLYPLMKPFSCQVGWGLITNEYIWILGHISSFCAPTPLLTPSSSHILFLCSWCFYKNKDDITDAYALIYSRFVVVSRLEFIENHLFPFYGFHVWYFSHIFRPVPFIYSCTRAPKVCSGFLLGCQVKLEIDLVLPSSAVPLKHMVHSNDRKACLLGDLNCPGNKQWTNDMGYTEDKWWLQNNPGHLFYQAGWDAG